LDSKGAIVTYWKWCYRCKSRITRRAHHKKTYNSCSVSSFLNCLIDLEDFGTTIFDDSLTSVYTSMLVKIGGASTKGGVDTLSMGAINTWTKYKIGTSNGGGSIDTSIRVGISTSRRGGCKIVVDGKVGMLLTGSMGTFAWEGIATSNMNWVITSTKEWMGSCSTWDVTVIDGISISSKYTPTWIIVGSPTCGNEIWNARGGVTKTCSSSIASNCWLRFWRGQSTRWYFDLDHGEWRKVFLLQDVLVSGNFAIFSTCSPFNSPFGWFTNLNASFKKVNLLVRTFVTCDKVDVQHFPCNREFFRNQNDYLNNCPKIYIRIVG